MSIPSPPPPSPSRQPSSDALARQLRVFQVLVIILVVVIAVGFGYYRYEKHLGQPVSIVVDGKSVAIVRDAAAANQLLAQAEDEAVGPAYAAHAPIRLQNVNFMRAPGGSELDTDADTIQRLMSVLTLRVPAWLIVVNGKPSVGLPTQAIAEQTLLLVKQHFVQMPPDDPIVGQPAILQKIAIVHKVISPTLTKPDAQSAAPYFWTPPSSKTYTVKPGDTGYSISLRFHIPFSDFLVANSSQNLNHLVPGDVVNVQRMPLLLSVEVKKTYTKTQRILPTGPPAAAGLQQVTYVVTYVDGQPTTQSVSNFELLEKPATAKQL